MKTSNSGIELIKGFEGFSTTAYWDMDGWSVGYGHHGASVGQVVTKEEAEQLLLQDLSVFEKAVSGVCPDLTQGQFDAAVSLCYNIGTTRFKNSATAALMAANPSPTPTLEKEWKEWRMAGGVVNEALVRRRAIEWNYYKRHSSTSGCLILVATAALAALGFIIAN